MSFCDTTLGCFSVVSALQDRYAENFLYCDIHLPIFFLCLGPDHLHTLIIDTIYLILQGTLLILKFSGLIASGLRKILHLLLDPFNFFINVHFRLIIGGTDDQALILNWGLPCIIIGILKVKGLKICNEYSKSTAGQGHVPNLDLIRFFSMWKTMHHIYHTAS